MSASASFPDRLQAALDRAGIDQSGLAKRLNVAPSVVSGWINEELLPSGKHMVGLPDALGVSGHWLLTGEGQIEPPDQPAGLYLVRPLPPNFGALAKGVAIGAIIPTDPPSSSVAEVSSQLLAALARASLPCPPDPPGALAPALRVEK